MESRNASFFEHIFPCLSKETGSSARLDDEVIQDKRQRDDIDLQDERQDQTEEEEVEPRRSKKARNEKLFGPDFVSFMVKNEPTSYREAVTSSKGQQWREAIKSEIDSILQNHTWELVDLPQGCKPLGYKWIFKKKMKSDGTIDKYKARLVIKGYRQRKGLDYFDTYSTVTRITSIRMILAIAALRNLEIHQMDVKTAFLNGDLEEEIYMNQPEGFIAPGQEGKFCRLDTSSGYVILCLYIDDVVDIEVCHVLLGRPWQYDMDATHQGVVSPKPKLETKTLVTLVASPKEFQAERKQTIVSFALVLNGVKDVMENAIPVVVGLHGVPKSITSGYFTGYSPFEVVYKSSPRHVVNLVDLPGKKNVQANMIVVGVQDTHEGTKMQATVRMALVPASKHQLNEGDVVVLRIDQDARYALSKLLQRETVAEYEKPVSPRLVLRTKIGDQEDPDVKDKQEVKNANDLIENIKDEEGKNNKDQQVFEADDDTNNDDFGCSLSPHKGVDLTVEYNPNGVFNDVGGVGYSKADGIWKLARRIEDGWPDNEQSENIACKISTASKFSAHEEFVYKYPYWNIDKLFDLPIVYSVSAVVSKMRRKGKQIIPSARGQGFNPHPYKAGGPFLPLVEPEAASLPLVGTGLSTSQPPPYTVEYGIKTHNPWKTDLASVMDDNGTDDGSNKKRQMIDEIGEKN
ncbi:retrotransposon protein, putative, ty1-copia subclass [Tanacetum coccineum]|uniref:Retrotransposon protein, putative, ty1-copia subclass n=1 Tax=Tanacetum coccineum TaxID=301880 RepID=A0ABQ5D4I9_9ASTR